MKTTPAFKQTIQDYLEKRVIEDPLFATSYSNPKKNIDDCVTYILNTVKNSGINGYTDDEVFNMAVHYYDEETIDIGAEINCQVVVNHKVELTEEEKAEAKEKAIRELINKEKDILKQKPMLPKVEIKKTDIKEIQTSLF